MTRGAPHGHGACRPPRVLLPDARVATVHEVTPAWLAERGLDGLLVDLDDTLLPAAAEAVAEDVYAWLHGLRAAGVKLAILSNGEHGRVRAVGEAAGVPALALAGKPFGHAFRRGLRLVGLPADRTAMLGDQLFTDVLGAKSAGLAAVLVTPLSPGKLPHTRLARRLERWVLGCSKRADATPGQVAQGGSASASVPRGPGEER